MTQEELNELQKKALEQFRSGQSLFGKDGAFAPMLKLVYLATKNIEKKWTSPLRKWSLTVQQLAIKFGDRLPLDLTRIPSSGG